MKNFYIFKCIPVYQEFTDWSLKARSGLLPASVSNRLLLPSCSTVSVSVEQLQERHTAHKAQDVNSLAYCRNNLLAPVKNSITYQSVYFFVFFLSDLTFSHRN